MKTIKELKEERGATLKSMTALVEERGESMDEKTLAAVKSFKDDINSLDEQISAIEDVRALAAQHSKPQGEQMKDKQSELRSNLDNFLRGKNGAKELRAVGAGDIGAGKETVPDDFLRELDEKILEFGVISGDARHLKTADNGTLKIPRIDDTANVGVWTAEHGTITPEDFATDEVTLSAHKVTTAIVISTELIEDSAFNMPSYIAGALGERLSRTMEDSYINGNGSSKPQGILGATGTKNVPSAGAGVIDADALAMITAIQPTSRAGASFYASDEAIMDMMSWVDAGGRPLLQTSASATQADGVKMSLYGYPVKPNCNLGTLATGQNPLIFGNASKYVIRDVRGVNIRRSDEVNILNDQVVFIATARVDANIITQNDAFAKLTMV